MIIILLLLGFMAGVCSGIFGIGGGIILVPSLMLILKFGQLESSAITLVSLLLPVGALGVWEFYKRGILREEHIRYGLLIALGLFLGTFIGAKLVQHFRPYYLAKGFSLLLLVVAVKLWFSVEA